MRIMGINSAYHESAACIIEDGRLKCFVEEERVNRIKHAKPALVDNPHQLPVGAIETCIATVGCDLKEIDLFAYSFSGEGRLQNICVDDYLEPLSWGTREGEETFHSSLLQVPAELEKQSGFPVAEKFLWVDHHLAHAASTFLCSEFDEALVLVFDGIGEFDSISAYHGMGGTLEKVFSVPYPHSIGLLWEKLCVFMGFSEHDACKLMGLSGYGDPSSMMGLFLRLARQDNEMGLCVDNGIVRFRSRDLYMIEQILGPARSAGENIEKRHTNIAASLQRFTEKVMVSICSMLKKRTGTKNLCLAGGTALNCVANTVIQTECGFDGIYIQPASNDAGSALGAALYAWCGKCGNERRFSLEHTFWGPGYEPERIEKSVEAAGLSAVQIAQPHFAAAELVSRGRIVGWFQGRMEMGPRALGNRSLLADPRRKYIRDILNRKIKHSEDFRPFAPSVLSEHAPDWFEIPARSRSADFMLFAYRARAARRGQIPAVVHIDNTARIQTVSNDTNPLYHSLIKSFYDLTGVPMVLNTSFNDSGPIVMTPEDAIATYLKTGIEDLFLGDFLITKKQGAQIESAGKLRGICKAA